MQPIVFIDSGVGGLAYLQHIREKLSRPYIYLADTQSFPYGLRQGDEILRSIRSLLDSLLASCQPEVIVLACNTASVACLQQLRSEYPSECFVGVVPALKPAGESRSERIALLSSAPTATDDYTEGLRANFVEQSIITIAADELISVIEECYPHLNSAKLDKILEECIEQITESRADGLILACTHFLHIRELFQKRLPQLRIFDSLDGVTNRLIDIVGTAKMPERLESTYCPFNTTDVLRESEWKSRSIDLPSDLVYLPTLYTSSPSERYHGIATMLEMAYGGVFGGK